jgi:fucose permease
MLNTMRRAGLVISLAGFAISVNTLPALVPWFSVRFNVPASLFGVIFLLQYASFTICSLVVGRLHYSRKLPLTTIVVVALLISSSCLFIIGLLPNYTYLIVVMVLIGGAGGLVESIGTTLLTSNDGSNKMLYTSQFFYALGAFFAPMAVGLLLDLGISVIQIGRLIAMFTFVIGIVVWLFVFQPWRWATRKVSLTNNHVVGNTTLEKNFNKDHSSQQEKTDHTTQKTPRIVSYAFPLLFLTMVSYVMIESAMGNWFAVYMHEALQSVLSQASFSLSLYWVGLGISRMFYMFIVVHKHPRVILLHMGIMLFAILLMLIPIDTTIGLGLLFFAVWLFGFGCGPIWPLLIEYCSRIFVRPHLIMYLVGAGSIGALTGPIVTSTLFSWIGIEKMILLFLLYVAIMLGTALISMTVASRHST